MKKSLDILLVRHAEAVVNTRQGIITGRADDSPLTGEGRHQANKLGLYLQGNGVMFEAVYSSPAQRAVDTAQISLKHYGGRHDIHVDERLHEMDQGEWVGLDRQAVYRGTVLKQIERLGKDFRAPKGESMNDVGGRLTAWSQSLLQQNLTSVIAYTHVVAIACFISAIFDMSHSQTRELMKKIDKTSMTLLRYRNGVWSIGYIGKLPVAE